MRSVARAPRGHGKTAPLRGKILNAFGQPVGEFLFLWSDGAAGPDAGELAHVLPVGARLAIENAHGERPQWSLVVEG